MSGSPSRHEKMVAAAQHLARQGFDISRMPTRLGKGGKYHWKDHVAPDPAFIPNLLGGAYNSVVIPRGENVIIDADSEEASAELTRMMPPGLAVLTPTSPHQHFYARYAKPETLPDFYEGGEVRRDPGGKDRPGGAGGMVIGPWSMTEAGIYTIADGPRDIPELPEEVAVWLRNRDVTGKKAVPLTNGHTEGPVLIAVGGYAMPEHIPEGGRYRAMLEYTAHLYNRGFTTEEMWMQVWGTLALRFTGPQLSMKEVRERFDRCVEQLPERLGERSIDRAQAKVIPLPPTPGGFIRSSAERDEPMVAASYLVNDLIKPGTIGLLAANTGMGKSIMRTELTLRLATGRGALFEHYGIPMAESVLVFDGENGETEEWLREEDMCASLGLTRAQLGLHYRVDDSVAFSLDLNEPQHQQAVREAIATFEPGLCVFDTIGTFTRGIEWGNELHKTISFLRSLVKPRDDGGVTSVLLLAHFNKVERYRGKRPDFDINDVMGQTVRFMDWAATVNAVENDDSKVRWRTFKRVPRTDLILEQKDGRWVVSYANIASPTTTKEKRQRQLLGALIAGAKRVEGTGGLAAWLASTGDGVTDRTLYRDMAEMLSKGWVSKSDDGMWSLDEAGRAVVVPVKLVGGSATDSTSAPSPYRGRAVSVSADPEASVSTMSASVSETE